ncbi:MAG: TetR/AcrR family transcriptional regulator [Gammaproteobacteria bacterium]|jgi:TetR/AcrR family transcriptional regulator, transcriptional repressor for nem operon
MARTNNKRERLTQAARQLIHASGYNQTTLADIAQAAEVPLGNVYYYFKTKDALGQAVIEAQLKEFEQLVSELDRLGEPRARIDGFLSLRVLDSDVVAAHGCPVAGLCTELNKSESPLASQANALLQAQLDWLTEQFQQLGRQEEAQELALQLLTQLQGATVLTHIFKDPRLITRQIANAKTWLDDII